MRKRLASAFPAIMKLSGGLNGLLYKGHNARGFLPTIESAANSGAHGNDVFDQTSVI